MRQGRENVSHGTANNLPGVLHGCERSFVSLRSLGATGIRDDHWDEVQVQSLTHGWLNADLECDACDDEGS